VTWLLPHSDAERLALARAYPFPAPSESYLLRAGRAVPLAALPPDAGRFAGRQPVIAHGSNRAPEQLRRKFGDAAEIPVSRAWLGDYDVVYSAHVSRYGSIAATLQHTPGTRVEVFVTWLSETQLARMHETELGGEVYVYGRMSGIDLDVDYGPAPRLDQAGVYISRRGCVAKANQPVALTAVAAHGRRHAALTQAQILELVRARHHPDRAPDTLILQTISDVTLRRALIAAMGKGAVPTAAPHFTELHR
jgi:hypothetical protein